MIRSQRFVRALTRSALLLLVLGIGVAAFAGPRRWFEGSDKVYVRLDNRFERIQEPDVHMDRALRAFDKKMQSLAADELEKAAAGFAYFADRSSGDDRRQLDLASHALNRLADDVRRGKVSEVTTLERAVEDAERVLEREPPKQAPTGPPAPRE